MLTSGAVPAFFQRWPSIGQRDTALHFTFAKNNKLKSDSPQFSILGSASLFD
jgi:hypothetical protein